MAGPLSLPLKGSAATKDLALLFSWDGYKGDHYLWKQTFHCRVDILADTDGCLAHRLSPSTLPPGRPRLYRVRALAQLERQGILLPSAVTGSGVWPVTQFWIKKWLLRGCLWGLLGKISHHDKKSCTKRNPTLSCLSSRDPNRGAATAIL